MKGCLSGAACPPRRCNRYCIAQRSSILCFFMRWVNPLTGNLMRIPLLRVVSGDNPWVAIGLSHPGYDATAGTYCVHLPAHRKSNACHAISPSASYDAPGANANVRIAMDSPSQRSPPLSASCWISSSTKVQALLSVATRSALALDRCGKPSGYSSERNGFGAGLPSEKCLGISLARLFVEQSIAADMKQTSCN